jgi:hypothetical protein
MASIERLILLLPYFNLTSTLSVGSWQVGPFESFNDRWPSDAFRTHAETLLAAYQDMHGNKVPRPALLVSSRREGAALRRNPRDIVALQRALAFAAIVGNPSPFAAERRSWAAITSDNADIHGWRLNPERRWVAYDTGSMMSRTLSGGWQIAEVSLHGMPRMFADVLQGSYAVASGAVDVRDPVLAPRVRTAMDWLIQAWRNSPSIRAADRVVALKIGFEALTGRSNSWEGPRNCAPCSRG